MKVPWWQDYLLCLWTPFRDLFGGHWLNETVSSHTCCHAILHECAASVPSKPPVFPEWPCLPCFLYTPDGCRWPSSLCSLTAQSQILFVMSAIPSSHQPLFFSCEDNIPPVPVTVSTSLRLFKTLTLPWLECYFQFFSVTGCVHPLPPHQRSQRGTTGNPGRFFISPQTTADRIDAIHCLLCPLCLCLEKTLEWLIWRTASPNPHGGLELQLEASFPHLWRVLQYSRTVSIGAHCEDTAPCYWILWWTRCPPVLPIVLAQPICSSCEWESAPVWKRRKVMVTRGERLSACSGLLSQGFLLIDSKKHPKWLPEGQSGADSDNGVMRGSEAHKR